MIIERIDIASFKKIFKRKFTNFCKSLPLFISFYVAEESISIINSIDSENLKEILKYSFDYTKSVQENIYLLNEELKSFFPVLIRKEKTKEKYSPEELNEMVVAGDVSLDEATSLVKEKITHWRVEKIFIKKDEIILINLITHIKYIFSLKTPVSVLLKHILEWNYNSEKAGELFFSKVLTAREIKSEAIRESEIK